MAFCHITTNIPGEKHGDLLEQKGGGGWPHIVFMDSDGNVLAEHEGARDAESFAKTGAKAKAFVDLKKKAEKGDKAAKLDFLIARLDLGQLNVTDAEKELKDLGKPSKDQQKKLDEILPNARVREVLKGIDSQEAQVDAGKKFYEMKKAGQPAPTGDNEIQGYWILMMMHAEKEKDAASYEEGLKALKAKFGSNPRAQRFFQQSEEKLKKLKEEK